MLDIDAIEESIKDLENSDTTFYNCEKLASLYIVREHLKNPNTRELDGIQRELDDILPAYTRYCDVKRKYQLHEITDVKVIDELQRVCDEIEDLFIAMYSGTDMCEERKILTKLVEKLNKKYCK